MATEAKPKDEEKNDLPLVEVVADAPEAAAQTAPDAGAAPTVDESVEALRKQVSDANAARLAAEQKAQQAEARARQADGGAQQSAMALLDGTIERLGGELDALESQLATAFSAGDHAAAAKIQRVMGEKSAQRQQVEIGKANYEAQLRAPQQQAQPQPVQYQDPAEELARRLDSVQPRSAQWIRQNAAVVRSPVGFQNLVNAHNIAMREHPEGSDGYINRIEGILGLSPTAARNETTDTTVALSGASAPSGGRQTAPPAAPPTRNGTGSAVNGRVRLTKDQADYATNVLGMTPEEYAKHLTNPRTQEQLKRTVN